MSSPRKTLNLEQPRLTSLSRDQLSLIARLDGFCLAWKNAIAKQRYTVAADAPSCLPAKIQTQTLKKKPKNHEIMSLKTKENKRSKSNILLFQFIN